MNRKLQNIFDLIQQSEKLDAEQKHNLLKAVKDADKELEITSFKLERTEKVKKTTAILLEETIEELEQKRKAVEVQNRELEIETALEKVRTIAMAMRKANDMLDVCKTSNQLLESLGVKEIRNVQTAIFYEQRGTYMNYEYYAKHDKTIVTETNYTNNKLHEEFALKMLKGKGEYFISHIKGKEVKDWIAYQKTTNVFIDSFLEKASSLNYYWFSLGSVALGISTYHPLTDEEINLFKRFLKVFELAYQRYLDIEKAEAQARESEIELALERVRSRTMAMQKSDELKEVIRVVYEQFVHLNINVDHAGFVVDYTPKGDWHFWIADEQDIPSKITHPYFESVWANQFNEAKEKGAAFFATNLNFEEKNKFYNELLSYVPGLPEASKDFYLSCPGLAATTVLFDNVSHYIENFSGTPYTDEENKILMRFGKVFQQTYTRFLDLQKAEAQAREAQIELALERVRARSVAMHKSDELLDVIGVVSEQLKQLGFHFDNVSFAENNQAHDYKFWLSLANQPGAYYMYVPYIDNPMFERVKEAQQKGLSIYSDVLTPEENRNWHKHVFDNNDMDFVSQDRKEYIFTKGFARSIAFLPNIMLIIGNYASKSYSKEENKIINRFATVFQQSYTRFLDLQKAEAQAREAQIEAALERVRARSLAMHHTSELQSVVDAVSQQLKNLDIDANGGAFITINNEVEKDIPIWGSSGAANYIQKVTIPFLDKPIFTQLRDAIKNRNDFLVEEYPHKEKIEFFQHLFNHSPWNLLPPKRKKELLSREGGYTRSLTVSRYTSIFIINHNGKKFSESDNEILKRFGKVFEQSYTRFLDLQKAEAQNKIIQAENERKSKELDEARELQLAMLPKKIPEHSHLDIKVFMQTATEVGGDYYDFSYHKDGSINIAIGDATGHGMKAGTLVTMMKSLFIANSSIMDIEDFFTSSNAAIKNSNLKRMMAAFAMLNIKDHTAKFINAAMPSLYHYRKKLGKVEEIEQHNLPLGAMAIENYKSTKISLTKGDALIMMSDGFPELHNPNKELFGYERAYSAIQKAADKQPEEIIKSLNNESIKWIGNKDLQDDVTFVVIKVK